MPSGIVAVVEHSVSGAAMGSLVETVDIEMGEEKLAAVA